MSASKITIENNPRLRGVTRVAMEWSFTAIMWALWVYLFLPLISLVMWAAGLRLFYVHLIEGAAMEKLATLLGQMGITVLVVFIVLRGWGYYNYYKFGRLERRKSRPLVDRNLLGAHFGLSANQVLALQNRKEIVWTGLYDEVSPVKRRGRRFDRHNTPHKEAA